MSVVSKEFHTIPSVQDHDARLCTTASKLLTVLDPFHGMKIALDDLCCPSGSLPPAACHFRNFVKGNLRPSLRSL